MFVRKSTILIVLLISCTSILLFVVIGNKSKVDYNEIQRYKLNSESLIKSLKLDAKLKVTVYSPTKKTKISVPLEKYVLGVVASEMPAKFNPEALKAQAVAARTYALSHLVEFGGTKCGQAKGEDLCDTVHCQVYSNFDVKVLSWSSSKRKEYKNKIINAVVATIGEVLTYDNKLVMHPLYFSTSTGKTEDSTTVFNFYEPYLKTVVSDGEELAPKFKSLKSITRWNFITTINSATHGAKLTNANLNQSIKIIQRNIATGLVLTIKVGKIEMSGTSFRKLFKLNSANFDIYINKTVQINCRGFGHDVGMSQFGAEAMAENGSSYIEILKHYYSGVEVQKLKN